MPSLDLVYRFLGVDAGAGREFDKMGLKASSLKAGLIGAGSAAVGLAAVIGVESVKSAAKFQSAMTLLHTQANVSTAAVGRLSKGVLAMAGQVGESPTVLAQAAYHIASIGQNSLTTAQELSVLRVASEGAKIGGANLVDVTNALDAAVVSGIHGVKNYSQTMGVLNATVGAGDMSMQDLAEAFGPLGAVLKGYNVTIQQAGAALAVFGDNNLRGAQAGTALRMAVQALAVPMKAGQTQLEAWGIKSGNLTAQLQHGGLTAALETLQKKMRANGVTAKDQGTILTEAFGKRAGTGLAVLMGELDRYEKKLHEVKKGGDTFASSWAGYSKTFQANVDKFKGGVEALIIQLGTKLLPTATKAMHWLATSGIADLQKFGAWFHRNESTIGDFGAAFITVFRAMFDAVFTMVRSTVDVLSAAFGWLPHWGGKFKQAKKDVDSFQDGVDSTLTTLAGKMNALGSKVGNEYGAGLVTGLKGQIGAVQSAANYLGGVMLKGTRYRLRSQSPSKEAAKIGVDYVNGLVLGMKSQNGTVKMWSQIIAESMIKPAEAAVTKQESVFQKANSRLKSLLSARQQAIASVASGITGSIGISNVLGQTDAAGNSFTGNIAQSQAANLGVLQTEFADIRKLENMGLSFGLIRQLTNMAPQDAVTLAQQIISGQDGSITSLNSTQRAITRTANQIGRLSVDSPASKQRIAEAKRVEVRDKRMLDISQLQLEELKAIKRDLHVGNVVITNHMTDKQIVDAYRRYERRLRHSS